MMVAKALNIVKETYLAIVLDRGYGGPVIVASPDGKLLQLEYRCLAFRFLILAVTVA